MTTTCSGKQSQRGYSTRRQLVTRSGAGVGLLAVAGSLGHGKSAVAAPSRRLRAQDTKLTLAMVDYTDETQKVLEEEILPAFSAEHDGVEVEVQYSSWDRYNEQLVTAFAGGVSPDVFQGGAVFVPQMAERDWALPLTSYVESAGADWDWEDFYPALRDDVTIDDEILAVPYRIDIRSFWYNSAQLEEAGISGPPTTWDELHEAAVALTQRDGDTITREGFHFSGPGAWQNDLQAYMIFLAQAGGRFLSEDLSTCALNEPEGVEALEFVRQLIVDEKVQPYPGFEDQGDATPFVLGTASSTNTSSVAENIANQYAPERVDQLHATLPLTGAAQATHVWVNKFMASSQTKEPDLAWALLQHLTSPAMLETYSASGLYTPPRASLTDADFMTENHRVILESTEYAQAYPKHPKLAEMFRPLATGLEGCLRGELSAEDALN